MMLDAILSRVERPRASVCVYKAYDRDGAILYVGISGHWPSRWVAHSRREDFFRSVGRLDVEWYPDRKAAAARERDLIAEHTPPWNVRRGVTPRPPKGIATVCITCWTWYSGEPEWWPPGAVCGDWSQGQSRPCPARVIPVTGLIRRFAEANWHTLKATVA